MVDYAVEHFATEEKYMLLYRYPDYDKHKAEHDTFTKKAMGLQERFKNSGMILTMELVFFLQKWLQQHILVTDQGFAKHFNANGLY
jgi:hemerythrin